MIPRQPPDPGNENPAVVGGALKTDETAATFAQIFANVNGRFCRTVSVAELVKNFLSIPAVLAVPAESKNTIAERMAP